MSSPAERLASLIARREELVGVIGLGCRHAARSVRLDRDTLTAQDAVAVTAHDSIDWAFVAEVAPLVATPVASTVPHARTW